MVRLFALCSRPRFLGALARLSVARRWKRWLQSKTRPPLSRRRRISQRSLPGSTTAAAWSPAGATRRELPGHGAARLCPDLAPGIYKPDFRAYLNDITGVRGTGTGEDEPFAAAIERLDVRVTDLRSWSGFTDQLWEERDRLQEQIVEGRQKRLTYRHERQVKAEAEALIIVEHCRDGSFALDDKGIH
jgi:hypothetical protein